jgi:hypothetical protein
MIYYLSVTEYDKWGNMTEAYLLDNYKDVSEDLEELIENAFKIEGDLKNGWKGCKGYDYYININDEYGNEHYHELVRL